MVPEPWILAALGGALLLLWLIATLSGLETVVLNVRRSRLQQMESPSISSAEALLDSPGHFQASAHLVKSLAESLFYAAAALLGLGASVQNEVPDRLSDLFKVAWPGLAAAAVVAFFVVTLLGETLPKALACRHPERTLLRWLTFIRAFTALATPLLWISGRVGRFLARSTGADPLSTTRAAHTEEEIKLLVEDSAEEGVLEEEEKEMIHSIIEFTDTIARQVMVPRIDIEGVDVTAPLEEVVRQVIATGHSRLPVYEQTLDSVIGIIHVKDVIAPLTSHATNVSIRSLMRKPYFVPEGKKLDELLQEMRSRRVPMAIVVDEFGGTSGLVTVEDVLEEIVGEIEDEYDVAEEPPVEEPAGGEGLLVDARMPIDDVNEELQLELPEGDYDTLGGFVFSLFGRPPEVGEQIRFESTEFVVEEMEGRRLQRLRVINRPPQPALESETEATAT
jgi:putative hemolysin